MKLSKELSSDLDEIRNPWEKDAEVVTEILMFDTVALVVLYRCSGAYQCMRYFFGGGTWHVSQDSENCSPEQAFQWLTDSMVQYQ